MTRDGLYLGNDEAGKALVLEGKELTTHAFCVGMTGSGKTGLCSVLLEEALGRGVPVIAVDPKGDLGNLLLALDPGNPSEFEPWVDPEQARREGKTVAQLAAEAAARAAQGLAESGLNREHLLSWRQRHEPRVYTPGSSVGLPVNVLGSMTPPANAAAEDIADGVDTLVRAILGLLRIPADPVRSREYILLFRLIEGAWREGRTVELGDLVRLTAEPPFDTVGALPLETFYPKRERTELVLSLNALLASPPFEAWRTGDPLDVATMLRAPDGRPRLSIFSIAHLPDEERLFAVALLLERVKAWMRRQPGSGDLRAVLYIDEIFGYFPPTQNPPTKRPLLLLLKQARAFGLGVVLATQNPVDLDYKGLANIGTWFVGRLQTDQDKNRIRDGLAGAAEAAGKSFAEIDRLLASVERRRFLHHSIHRPAPGLLKTRWAYSFLRGPLSRDELSRLAAPARASAPSSAAGAAAANSPETTGAVTSPVDSSLGPLFGEGVGEAQPYALVKFALRYKVGRSATQEQTYSFAFPLEGAAAMGEALEGDPRLLRAEDALTEAPPKGMTLARGPAWLGEAKLNALTRVVKERLPSKLETRLFFDPETKLVSMPDESKDDFILRVRKAYDTGKDTQAVERKLEKKRLELIQAEEQLANRQREKMASIGTAVMDNLGLVFGKKRKLTGVGSVLSKDRMADAAESRVELLRQEIATLTEQRNQVSQVDPARFEERVMVPGPRDWSLLRLAIVYLA